MTSPTPPQSNKELLFACLHSLVDGGLLTVNGRTKIIELLAGIGILPVGESPTRELESEIERLKYLVAESVYMPGQWECPTCGYVLSRRIIHFPSGDVSANTSTPALTCPNDGAKMSRVEWRKALEVARNDSFTAKCTACPAFLDLTDPSWRWNGEMWEHKCPDAHPQAGHFQSMPWTFRHMIDLLDQFHPRAMRLLRKRKNFIVIAEDEPYFMKAYALIRESEMQKGRWSKEDEESYNAAAQESSDSPLADSPQ